MPQRRECEQQVDADIKNLWAENGIKGTLDMEWVQRQLVRQPCPHTRSGPRDQAHAETAPKPCHFGSFLDHVSRGLRGRQGCSPQGRRSVRRCSASARGTAKRGARRQRRNTSASSTTSTSSRRANDPSKGHLPHSNCSKQLFPAKMPGLYSRPLGHFLTSAHILWFDCTL